MLLSSMYVYNNNMISVAQTIKSVIGNPCIGFSSHAYKESKIDSYSKL